MAKQFKILSKRKKKKIVEIIKKRLNKFNQSDLTDETTKNLVNIQYDNLKLTLDTHEYGKLEMIVSFRFVVEALMLTMIIEAMAPELRDLKDQLLPMLVDE